MNGEIDDPSGSPAPTLCRPAREYRAIYQSGDPVDFVMLPVGYPEPNWTALIEEGNRITRAEIKGWLGTIFCTNTSLEDLYTNLEALYRDINLNSCHRHTEPGHSQKPPLQAASDSP